MKHAHEMQRNRKLPAVVLSAVGMTAVVAGFAFWAVQRQTASPGERPGAGAEHRRDAPRSMTPGITTAQIRNQGSATPEVTITSRDGSMTFRVPKPGEPDYDDYVEMTQHPRFRSAMEGRPGYAMPYDPEWRTMVTGKREVAPMSFQLEDGVDSMQHLAQALLEALRVKDHDALQRLRVTRHEFEDLMWPEFPQSRPYLRIESEEAWIAHHNSSAAAVATLLRKWGGRNLELIAVDYGDSFKYTNFTLYQGVKLRVRTAGTGETFEITEIPSIVGCNGQFKAYTYRS